MASQARILGVYLRARRSIEPFGSRSLLPWRPSDQQLVLKALCFITRQFNNQHLLEPGFRAEVSKSQIAPAVVIEPHVMRHACSAAGGAAASDSAPLLPGTAWRKPSRQ